MKKTRSDNTLNVRIKPPDKIIKKKDKKNTARDDHLNSLNSELRND